MTRRFEIRYNRWCLWGLGVLGMGPRFSGVEVGDERVSVRMGWAFRVRIARSDIAAADSDDDPVWGWGVHGWRGRWLVTSVGSWGLPG